MNKEIIERLEWLANECEDYAITPDVKDDIKAILNYTNEQEEEIEYLRSVVENMGRKKDIYW